MSCNCGNHPSVAMPMYAPPGHNCNHINHMFDPNPPAFFGTWKHMSGFDPTGKVSVCQPGVESGLYNNMGPLNCNCPCTSIMSLTGVETTAKIILEVTLTYASSKQNTVEVAPGGIYMFTYLEDGELKDCCGLVTNIFKVESLEENTNLYKIRVDCSSNYGSNIVVFKTDQIRAVEKYKNYMFESTKLTNCEAKSRAAIAAVIKDAIVVNAELDKDKNFIRGEIIYGVLENGKLIDATVKGTNETGHIMYVVDAVCQSGTIVSGTIMNGILRSGDVDGTVDEETGITTKATVKGILTNVVIYNAASKGGFTDDGSGTLVDPTIEDSTLYNATFSGNMVTTGGITIGNITTGGVTVTEGTAVGGVAVGLINGRQFKIVDGTTTGTMTTIGGTLVGGKISGGTRVGNAIYGATITGGALTGGVTTGGTTTGDIEPASASDIRVITTPFEGDDAPEVKPPEDCLWLGEHPDGSLYTNLGTTTMGTIRQTIGNEG